MEKQYSLAASLICANPLYLEDDVLPLIQGKIDYIHFDVMDGQFVPRLGLYPEILSSLRANFQGWLPKVDVHIMANDPESYIDTFAKAGADYFVFHIEATKHPHRVIQNIISSGMKPGIALNINTANEELQYIMQDLRIVTLMAINPGIVGSKLIPTIYDKIDHLRMYRNAFEIKKENLLIQIDGGVTFDTARPLIEAGADILVCGNGTIFRPQDGTINEQIEKLRETLKLEDIGN